ncbi:MAG TPA: ABC transporter substrate-binding protein, partial [Longimicrobiales bacterium]|nr:ABC transporter substrate-binding protein [Longimicrobiales bacterium]
MIRAPRARVAAALAIALLASSCTGGGKPEPTGTPSASPLPRGGTLHVGTFRWYAPGPIDPTTGLGEPPGGWVCCLTRTLYSYTGRPTDEGGSVLHPDLATGPPEISADGMTWTFRVKAGLNYAPPLQDVEITAADVGRAIERNLTPAPKAIQVYTGPLLGAGVAGYFSNIVQGAEDFSTGNADSISGLETPDPHTLRVRLTRPVGDLDYRFSLFSTAPIPPNPFRPEDRLGVAQWHEEDGYERVLVSS